MFSIYNTKYLIFRVRIFDPTKQRRRCRGTGGAVGSVEFLQFRKKAEHFLQQHLGDAAVAKVRSGEPLTADDIADLQRIPVAAGIGNDDTFAEASEKAGGSHSPSVPAVDFPTSLVKSAKEQPGHIVGSSYVLTSCGVNGCLLNTLRFGGLPGHHCDHDVN